MQREKTMKSLCQFLPLFFFLPFCFSRLIEESTVKEAKSELAGSLPRFNPSKSKQISSHPRVFLYEGFLSDYECEHLIYLAQGKKERSLLVDNYTNNGTQNRSLTGTRIFLNPGQDEFVSKIEERISLWTLIPIEFGSGIQIKHYKANENYHEENKSNSTLATILIFLSNVTNGGELIFPKSTTKNSDEPNSCGSSNFAIKPKKGTAIIFFNLNLDSTEDQTSLHSECPVLQGAKWSAVKFIHIKPFDRQKDEALTVDFDHVKKGEALTVDFDRTEECVDMDGNCASWAKNGECERNSVFMLGSTDYYGTCRKSCNAC